MIKLVIVLRVYEFTTKQFVYEILVSDENNTNLNFWNTEFHVPFAYLDTTKFYWILKVKTCNNYTNQYILYINDICMGLSAPIGNNDANDELREQHCKIIKCKSNCDTIATNNTSKQTKNKCKSTRHCCKHNYHTSSNRLFTSTCFSNHALNYGAVTSTNNNKKHNKKYVSSSSTSLSEASSTVDNRANLVPVHQKRHSKTKSQQQPPPSHMATALQPKYFSTNTISCNCSRKNDTKSDNCCHQKRKLSGFNSFFRRISCMSSSLQRLTSFSNGKISKSLKNIKAGKNISVVIIPTEFFVNLYELQRCQQTRILIKIQYNVLSSSISSIKLDEIANEMAFHQYINTTTTTTSCSTSTNNLNKIRVIKSTNTRPKSADVNVIKKNNNFINVHDWDFETDATNGSSNNLLVDDSGIVACGGSGIRRLNTNRSSSTSDGCVDDVDVKKIHKKNISDDKYKIVNIATSSEEIIFYDNVAFEDTFAIDNHNANNIDRNNYTEHIYEDMSAFNKTNTELNALNQLRNYVCENDDDDIDTVVKTAGNNCGKNKTKKFQADDKSNAKKVTIENKKYNLYLDKANITTEL